MQNMIQVLNAPNPAHIVVNPKLSSGKRMQAELVSGFRVWQMWELLESVDGLREALHGSVLNVGSIAHKIWKNGDRLRTRLVSNTIEAKGRKVKIIASRIRGAHGNVFKLIGQFVDQRSERWFEAMVEVPISNGARNSRRRRVLN